MINVFFGGTLTQDLQEDRGLAHPYHSIHSVECIEGSQLEQLFGASFLVNSYHHQAVNNPGRGVSVTARASDGTIEAVEIADHPFAAGVQWHPECMYLTSRKMSRIFSAFIKACRN